MGRAKDILNSLTETDSNIQSKITLLNKQSWELENKKGKLIDKINSVGIYSPEAKNIQHDIKKLDIEMNKNSIAVFKLRIDQAKKDLSPSEAATAIKYYTEMLNMFQGFLKSKEG
jgi:hypothetical protein